MKCDHVVVQTLCASENAMKLDPLPNGANVGCTTHHNASFFQFSCWIMRKKTPLTWLSSETPFVLYESGHLSQGCRFGRRKDISQIPLQSDCIPYK